MVLRELDRHNLEPRALGRSDYPTELPLREVYLLAKRCSGGVVLGFEQFYGAGGTWKRGASEERSTSEAVRFPVFVHRMPTPEMKADSRRALQAVFQKWQASVRTHYYQ